MKKSGFIAILLALPLAAMAQQYPIFTDTFAGSSLNHTSIVTGTPYSSSTSYDIASSKADTTGPTIGANQLRLSLNGGTTSGFMEAQALFAKSPVSLNTIGDYITLTYTFTNTTGTLLAGGTSSYIFNGLYNSAGVPPVAGALNNSGLSTTSGSAFATNNCANWQGYCSRISNGGTSSQYTRPAQNGAGTAANNQDLVGNNTGSGTYVNPTGSSVDGITETVSLPLTSGAVYTISYTIELTDTNTPTLTITNALYAGTDMTVAPIFSQTNVATGATYLTNSFDGFAIGLFNKGANLNPLMDISSITISASIFGTPGPSFGVLGGGTGCPGDSFPLGLTGSVNTNDYRVFTNGVFDGVVVSGTGSALSFPPETVTSVSLTNTIQASNIVSGFTGFMSGEAVVAPFGAPVITTQPTNVLVAANSIATFTVASSGSGLGYQWFRNGTKLTNTNEFSGTTSSTLVISPVSAGDQATTVNGYYVVITNGCGVESISTTNSLTLGSPANLTWQGNNPDNTWDLATTPNFFNGTTTTVFHNGDNVTFDDSALLFVVNLNGTYLAPGTLTENAGSSYAFTGSGSIAGPTTLVMNGLGTLTLSNANTYTGGTTISNGIISERNGNFASFGPGPVNLAGGTLDIPFTSSSTVGMSNTINTVTNSTLQYDTTGTFAFIFSGALTGNSNATLTINLQNGATATGRLRMYGQFTNNANVVLNSIGSQVELAPYLPSGDQIFNGVISGNYGRFTPRGAGAVIFNNTNTFNDSLASQTVIGYSVFLSSGNVGIGADSVSSTPGVIDASPVGTGMFGINVGAESGTCSLFSSGGAHTLLNKVVYTSTTNTVTFVLGGTNNLTLAGEFDLANTAVDSTGTNRTLQVTNTALTTISGIVTDGSAGNPALASGLTKTGAGILALSAANTYGGLTTVGNGTLQVNGSIGGAGVTVTNGALGGTGTINSAVTNSGTGAIAPGTSAIGTLTFNSSLTIGGNLFFKLNKSLGQTSDRANVTGTLSNTGTGTLTVTNLGPALAAGDRFVLFNKAVTGGGTIAVTGAGLTWTNNLAVDGSITAGPASSTVATNPTNMTFSVSGTNLSVSWPADHLGWYLQMQTNNLNSNGWVDVTGSSTVTNVVIPIVPGTPHVFYRMSLNP